MNLPSPPIELISKALVRERQKSGLSLSELSRKAGIAKSTLSQLESGSGNPSIETLWALCVALDIPFARLIEEKQEAVTVIRHGRRYRSVPNTRIIWPFYSHQPPQIRDVIFILWLPSPVVIVFQNLICMASASTSLLCLAER